MSKNYSKAYTEVLEIIKYFSKEEYDKIPYEKIKFYKENMDKTYDFKINPNINLEEQNISQEANAIIVNLYKKYYATEEEKQKIDEILGLNEKKTEIEKSKKYNSNNFFKEKKVQNNNINVEKTNLPVKIKRENYFISFINYIKSLFRK